MHYKFLKLLHKDSLLLPSEACISWKKQSWNLRLLQILMLVEKHQVKEICRTCMRPNKRCVGYI